MHWLCVTYAQGDVLWQSRCMFASAAQMAELMTSEVMTHAAANEAANLLLTCKLLLPLLQGLQQVWARKLAIYCPGLVCFCYVVDQHTAQRCHVGSGSPDRL